MLDKLEKRKLRKQLFYHLDGLAMCGVVPVLHEWAVLERVFLASGDVDQLAAEYRANSGYLNVALRMLCSQGLLEAARAEDRINYRPAVGKTPTDWYQHSSSYVAGRNWMMCIVGSWNTPNKALAPGDLMSMEVLMDAWRDMPDEGIMSRIKSHWKGH